MLFRDMLMVAATQGGGVVAPVTEYVNGGNFSNAALWTLSTPASTSISGGKLNFTAAAGTRRCYQASLGTYVFAAIYRVSGVASGYSADSIIIRIAADATGLGGSSITVSAGDPEWPVANGPFSVDFGVGTIAGQNHMIGATAGGAFSIDNFSIVPL